jgi:hypothetical protein
MEVIWFVVWDDMGRCLLGFGLSDYLLYPRKSSGGYYWCFFLVQWCICFGVFDEYRVIVAGC